MSFLTTGGQPRRLPRILALTCFGIGLAVAAALALAIFFERHDTIHDAERQFTQLTIVVAEQAERALESIDLLLESTVSRVARSAPGDLSAHLSIQTYLSRQSDGLPQLYSVLVVNADGDLIIDSESKAPRRYNGSNTEGFRYYRDGGTESVHISAPNKSRLSGRWVVVMSRRITGQDGSFGGVAMAAVDLYYFMDFYGAISLDNGGAISWMHKNGALLLRHPFDESIFRRSMADSPVHRAFAAGRTSGFVHEVSPLDGTEHVLAFRALKFYPVMVIVGNSAETVLAPWWTFAFTLVGIGFVVISGLAAASVLLVRLAHREENLLGQAQEARAVAELASKAAERASRAKSEFLAGISHDLRTPLNSIIGFSDVLLGGLGGALSDRQREYIQYISTAGVHLLSLINNLLDLAKIEANRLTILDDKFELRSVIDECMRLVSAQAGAGRVTLVPYDTRQFGLRADPVRLRQIIFNLLSNAIKFTSPGGTVEARSILAEDGSLVISVTDTGIGMSEQEIATALQPYGQVANQYTRRHDGSGLGLPLVHALTEVHGGRVEIHSIPGKGTTVSVIMPATRVLLLDSETWAA